MAIKKTARPVRPNKGIELYYQRAIQGLVKRMTNSVLWWLRAEYRKEEPQIMQNTTVTQDALPSRLLQKKMKSMLRKWRKEFNEQAEQLALNFLTRTHTAVTSQVTESLKAAGLAIKPQMSRAEQDIMASLTIENVNLIKSIPTRYFEEVDGLVQRAVQFGRDVDFLQEELNKRYNITMRRARFIARDQVNKATEQIAMAKHKALGIDRAVWKHTPVGKTYRHSHIDMDGKEFSLSEGMYDSEVGYNITPGELPGCHCVYQIVLPELG